MREHFNHAIINFMHIQTTNPTHHNPDPPTPAPPPPNLPIKLIIAEIKNKQKIMHIFLLLQFNLIK